MNVRFEANNGHDASGPLCPLMTHSGHGQRATLALPAPSPQTQWQELKQLARDGGGYDGNLHLRTCNRRTESMNRFIGGND